MEYRAAKTGERDAVLDLLGLWYGDRVFFERYNTTDPKFRDALCLVASDNGTLVSTVQIFDRKIGLLGQTVPLGGIGSVFTREDYRHKGVASALMRLSVETMIREGFEMSLLFAERLTFYNMFGWRELNRTATILDGVIALPCLGDLAIDVFDFDRDLAEIMEIHRQYTGRFNVAAVRDFDDWRGNCAFAGNQPMHPGEGSEEYFILAREGDRARAGSHPGSIRAYARAIRLYGVSMLMEYGYQDGAQDSLFALMRHLAESAKGAPSSFRLLGDHRHAARLRSGSGPTTPTDTIVTFTTHDRNLERRLSAAGVRLTHQANTNHMWKILAPAKLAARLGIAEPKLERKVRAILGDDASLYWPADRF